MTLTASPSVSVDISRFIDERPVRGFQIRLLVLCAATLIVDGFDTQAIGYVAPDLARDWHLSKGALGPVFSAGLFGLMIGALVFGPVADRLGRKNVIVLSTVAFGLGSLATAFAPDVYWLMALRFITGLGLGGAMPNTIALTSEFSPHRRRATMVMIMFCGFSVGAALGGFLAAALLPAYGWRSVFLVGGIVPLFYALVLARTLPESIRFLALAGRNKEQVSSILRRVDPSVTLSPDVTFQVQEAKLAGLPVSHLFTQNRTATTLLFWVVFFMSLLDLYLLSNWLPTVVSDLGASSSTASVIGALLQVGGVVGTISLGSLIDRFSFRALAVTYLIASLGIAAIGFSGHSLALTSMAIFAAGFCVVGGQIASNALTAAYYPTTIRSTGVGWALGIGRIGSIIGPLVGGVMLSNQLPLRTVFLVAAVPALCAAFAAALLGRVGRPAE